MPVISYVHKPPKDPIAAVEEIKGMNMKSQGAEEGENKNQGIDKSLGRIFPSGPL